jgi:acetyl esterase
MFHLDPDALVLLDMMRAAGRPPFEEMTPEEARAAYAASREALSPEPEQVAETREMAASGPHGDVPLRLYRPASGVSTAALPVLVYFHGGGWLLGGLDSHDVVCRRFANAARCAVVSVDYRMAPEHKFPAAVNDSEAALRFVAENAAQFGADPARLAVGGDSAGGNLAAVMALMARDGALPPVRFQMLIYPAVDMAMVTVSSQAVREGVPLTSGTMKWFIDHYLRSPADVTNWRASPLRAPSLAGTAPALVLTASADPLRDEGIAYAERLEREGVRTKLLHFSDQVHGFISSGKVIRAADTAIDMCAAVLRQALGAR